jgi:hypothetical protein
MADEPCQWLGAAPPGGEGAGSRGVRNCNCRPQFRDCVRIVGQRSQGECKGFARWNRCKHVEGLQALQKRGLI